MQFKKSLLDPEDEGTKISRKVDNFHQATLPNLNYGEKNVDICTLTLGAPHNITSVFEWSTEARREQTVLNQAQEETLLLSPFLLVTLHYFRHFGRQLSPYICFIPRLISPGVPSLSIHDWKDRLIESISGWPPKGRDIAIPSHVRQTRPRVPANSVGVQSTR